MREIFLYACAHCQSANRLAFILKALRPKLGRADFVDALGFSPLFYAAFTRASRAERAFCYNRFMSRTASKTFENDGAAGAGSPRQARCPEAGSILSRPGLENEFELGDPVMGIDEAGRGPLAGPVFAAAVSVPVKVAERLAAGAWREVNDSKKLPEAKRTGLAAVIKDTPECIYAVASASPAEIDRLNILRATHLAMKRAALALAEKAASGAGDASQFSILVDGLPVRTLPFPSRNLVKGDSKSLLIAAASILAKTSRDAYCLEMEERFPGYGFAVHKGYPTPAHLEALRRLGPCEEHRRSFGPVREQWLF